MRNLRRWKRYCLGDGAVYFDQRPKTLEALTKMLSLKVASDLLQVGEVRQESSSDSDHCANVECAILSTCARLEIIISIELASSIIMNNEIESLIKDATAQFLSDQIISQRRKKLSYIINRILPFSVFDKPSRLHTESFPQVQNQDSSKTKELMTSFLENMECTTGIYDVSRRMCKVAAGLQDRATFRPFSARDAHIMAQIKQTVPFGLHLSLKGVNTDVDDQPILLKNHKQPELSSVKVTKLVFDTALHAGKAARSPKVVPILNILRDESNGADGPQDLSRQAALSAINLAVDPSVKTCVAKVKAMEASSAISELQARVKRKSKDMGIRVGSENDKRLKSMLHKRTMDLRNGKAVDIEEVLKTLEMEV